MFQLFACSAPAIEWLLKGFYNEFYLQNGSGGFFWKILFLSLSELDKANNFFVIHCHQNGIAQKNFCESNLLKDGSQVNVEIFQLKRMSESFHICSLYEYRDG
jgi:hypothetical protein